MNHRIIKPFTFKSKDGESVEPSVTEFAGGVSLRYNFSNLHGVILFQHYLSNGVEFEHIYFEKETQYDYLILESYSNCEIDKILQMMETIFQKPKYQSNN